MDDNQLQSILGGLSQNQGNTLNMMRGINQANSPYGNPSQGMQDPSAQMAAESQANMSANQAQANQTGGLIGSLLGGGGSGGSGGGGSSLSGLASILSLFA